MGKDKFPDKFTLPVEPLNCDFAPGRDHHIGGQEQLDILELCGNIFPIG